MSWTLAFTILTIIGIVTLALVRTLRPDRQASGLTELSVLLAAYAAVYGPVGVGFVTVNEIDPDLSSLSPFVAGALMGALIAVLVAGGLWLATVLALWVLRRPIELPSRRVGVRWAVLLVGAVALVFGLAMPLLETLADGSSAWLWIAMGLFYAAFYMVQSFVVPWLTFLRLPRLGESPDSGDLQPWVDDVMIRNGKRPIGVRVYEGSLVNAFVLWGIRGPWLLVGEGLLRKMSRSEVRAVLAHEIAHLLRRDHVRLLLSGIVWAAAMTVCTMLVMAPLYEAGRDVFGVMATATANTLYFVALGFVMRRMEYATDRQAVGLLDGRGGPLAAALEKLATLKKTPLDHKSLTHPSVQDRIKAIDRESVRLQQSSAELTG